MILFLVMILIRHDLGQSLWEEYRSTNDTCLESFCYITLYHWTVYKKTWPMLPVLHGFLCLAWRGFERILSCITTTGYHGFIMGIRPFLAGNWSISTWNRDRRHFSDYQEGSNPRHLRLNWLVMVLSKFCVVLTTRNILLQILPIKTHYFLFPTREWFTPMPPTDLHPRIGKSTTPVRKI